MQQFDSRCLPLSFLEVDAATRTQRHRPKGCTGIKWKKLKIKLNRSSIAYEYKHFQVQWRTRREVHRLSNWLPGNKVLNGILCDALCIQCEHHLWYAFNWKLTDEKHFGPVLIRPTFVPSLLSIEWDPCVIKNLRYKVIQSTSGDENSRIDDKTIWKNLVLAKDHDECPARNR